MNRKQDGKQIAIILASYEAEDLATEIDNARSELETGFPYQFPLLRRLANLLDSYWPSKAEEPQKSSIPP